MPPSPLAHDLPSLGCAAHPMKTRAETNASLPSAITTGGMHAKVSLKGRVRPCIAHVAAEGSAAEPSSSSPPLTCERKRGRRG
eukprot:4142788-Prymnesium_polylepis.1